MTKHVLILIAACLVAATQASWSETADIASNKPERAPSIALIIDDMGDRLQEDLRAISLPGPIAYSFLPQTPHSRQLAELAYQHNKEVMLHLPMQAMEQRRLGAGAITLNMPRQEVIDNLNAGLDAVPHVIGINNHMGSLMTRHPGHMSWLMQEIHRRGDLFFVDSRTTAATVAEQVAEETGVPHLRRDVFLDNEISAAEIAQQFQRLISLAKKNGAALAIAHPHPESIRFLEQQLPRLAEFGIQLIPVSELVQRKNPGYLATGRVVARHEKDGPLASRNYRAPAVDETTP